jgi:hypothetical protein
MSDKKKPIPPRTGNPGSVFKPQKHNFDRFVDQILPDVEDGDPLDLLEPEYVAAKLRVSLVWLAAARANAFGPPFVRLSPSVVRYPRGGFIDYLKSRSEIPEKGKVRVSSRRGVPRKKLQAAE